jgi:hypothetical protein
MKVILPLFIGLLFLKRFNQLFYRPRRKGKQHLALRGVGVTLRLPARRASLQLGEAGGQTRSFLNPLLMFFRSMVCLSHQPYYFSTRWNTNGPIIPSFHYSNCERSELSSILVQPDVVTPGIAFLKKFYADAFTVTP